jgi:soluble lytic murein transglycosylase-like protein
LREAHYHNLDPAIAAGQIHQESGWDISAASPYAAGLAQFTPETEAWARAAFSQLRGGAGSSDPRWAIRAMCAYDRWLMDRVDQRYADALRAYNGGLGYIIKERGCAPQTPPQSSPFQGEVREGFACCRKFRSVAACKENLEYPVRIMTIHAPMYRRIINPYSEAQS